MVLRVGVVTIPFDNATWKFSNDRSRKTKIHKTQPFNKSKENFLMRPLQDDGYTNWIQTDGGRQAHGGTLNMEDTADTVYRKQSKKRVTCNVRKTQIREGAKTKFQQKII